VDVGSLFVTNTQATKLIEPGKCSLHHPTPSSETAAVARVALGQERQNVASTEASANRLCIVSVVTHDALRTTSRSYSPSLQRWDRIHQLQGLFCVVTVGSG